MASHETIQRDLETGEIEDDQTMEYVSLKIMADEVVQLEYALSPDLQRNLLRNVHARAHAFEMQGKIGVSKKYGTCVACSTEKLTGKCWMFSCTAGHVVTCDKCSTKVRLDESNMGNCWICRERALFKTVHNP